MSIVRLPEDLFALRRTECLVELDVPYVVAQIDPELGVHTIVDSTAHSAVIVNEPGNGRRVRVVEIGKILDGLVGVARIFWQVHDSSIYKKV